jgi:hypothetical protein
MLMPLPLLLFHLINILSFLLSLTYSILFHPPHTSIITALSSFVNTNSLIFPLPSINSSPSTLLLSFLFYHTSHSSHSFPAHSTPLYFSLLSLHSTLFLTTSHITQAPSVAVWTIALVTPRTSHLCSPAHSQSWDSLALTHSLDSTQLVRTHTCTYM